MAIHSSILAWEIPWTEELGRLYSPGGRKSRTRLSDNRQIMISQEQRILSLDSVQDFSRMSENKSCGSLET